MKRPPLRLPLRLLEACGLNRLFAFLHRREVIILRYHGVIDADAAANADGRAGGPLAADALRSQLRALLRRYRVIRLEDAVEMIAGRRPVQPYSVVLTFDDGYRNNATVAARVLGEFGVPGAFFLTTDFVDGAGPLWFDRLEHALAHAGVEPLEGLRWPHDARQAAPAPSNRDGSRTPAAALAALKARLKRCDRAEIERVVGEIEARATSRLTQTWRADDRVAPMTWEQARALHRAGMTIGSHTCSHQILAAVSDEHARRELIDSRRRIEAQLGEACTAFAYPNGEHGDFTPRTGELLRECGYTCGLTTVEGRARPGDDVFELRRVAAGRPVDPCKFLAELSGLLPWLRSWRPGGRTVEPPVEPHAAGRPQRPGPRAGRLPRGWTLTTITQPAQLAAMRDEWNALLAESPSHCVFLTWEWATTWLEAVHPEAELLILVLRDSDGRLAGLAPLYRTRLRLLGLLPCRGLRVVGDRFSGGEYGDLIVRRDIADDAAAALLRALRRRGGWDCLWMPNVAAWDDTAGRLARACTSAAAPLRERTREFAAVPLPAAYDEYLASLSRNARSTLRRQSRAAEQDGAEVSLCRGESDLKDMLPALFDLHERRWRAAGRAGSFRRKPRMRRFYERFAPVALDRGWLRLFGLRLGGAWRAVQFGYACGGKFHQLQEGYDPDAPAGIGNVLRSFVIRACIEEGLVEYDFLGGFSEHKRRWGARRREGRDVLIGGASLRSRLLLARPVWPTGRFLREVADRPDLDPAGSPSAGEP